MADEPDLPIARRGDIDWRLLAALLSHSVVTHICITIVRVTTSYRTVELDLPVLWLGVISAAFAILPVFMAVGLGRFIDRGNDALACWIGAALILIASAGFWAWPASGLTLLAFTIFLGTGHMFCMASHQMLAVRAANARGREAAFGHYMVAASIGQGLGPYIVGWVGGASTVPPTGQLFGLGLIAAVACFAVALTIRPAARKPDQAEAGHLVTVATLFRTPGMAAFIAASVVTVTSLDLLVIYLPLLGAERDIDASAIGLLLAVRSAAALVGRVFYARLILAVGRRPLTLTTIFMGAVAFALLAVPALPLMYVAVIVLGFALGIASTTTLTGIIALAPAEARATALSLRITGNRVGQVLLPFLAGVVAAATGVGGILVGIAVSLAASGTAVHLSRRQP
jgi:predicted MFS family arabinose efflux permease